jgi:hypothetical protein
MARSKLGYVLTIGVIFVLIYGLYIFVGQQQQTTSNSLLIDIPEARSRRFGLIIDTRTPNERETLGYYPNSIPISIDKLQTQVPMDISNKKTWILVYSNGDDRAKVGADVLYRMGYPNVRYINQSYLSLMPGSTF